MTGSLQEKRGIYQCVLNYKDKEGKRKQKWISTNLPVKGNKRKAEKMLNDLISQYSEADLLPKGENIKFTDYAQKWLERKRGTIEQCTWDGYYNSVMKHVVPYFGKLALNIQDVKPIHISEYYNYKFRNGKCNNSGGLSICSLKAHRFVLKCIFNSALLVDEIIKKNPAVNIPLPKIEKEQKKCWSLSKSRTSK